MKLAPIRFIISKRISHLHFYLPSSLLDVVTTSIITTTTLIIHLRYVLHTATIIKTSRVGCRRLGYRRVHVDEIISTGNAKDGVLPG